MIWKTPTKSMLYDVQWIHITKWMKYKFGGAACGFCSKVSINVSETHTHTQTTISTNRPTTLSLPSSAAVGDTSIFLLSSAAEKE